MIYVVNTITILTSSMLLSEIILYLTSFFFIGKSVFSSTSINVKAKYDSCLKLTLKLYFKKISITHKLLLIKSRAESNINFSLSKKTNIIMHLILNIFNLSLTKLMKIISIKRI